MTELIGYLASSLVVASLAMTSVVRLRVVSLIGSLVFVVYGGLLGSIPIILTNAAVAGLNVFYLRKEFGPKRDVGAVPIAADAPFLADFLGSHLSDIRQSQPEFALSDASGPDVVALMLTRDGLPAGAVVARRSGERAEVVLDYVMTAYRDSRIGAWLYGEGAKVWRDLGVQELVTTPRTPTHRKYLEAVGFTGDVPAGSALTKRLN